MSSSNPNPDGPATISGALASFPQGIKDEFRQAAAVFAKRFWIVDNSGSMASTDGTALITTQAGKDKPIACSRWVELCSSLTFQANAATHLNARTEFRFLNAPGNGAPQSYEVGAGNGVERDLATMKVMLESEPTSRTPLNAHINAVVREVKEMAPTLRRDGQRVAVIIASDGVATDGDVRGSLSKLIGLPVWVVIRLCTSDDDLVDYWNNVDQDLELEMDVLDDLHAEAIEIAGWNAWLNYGPELHKLREFGSPRKTFDMLEEKAFTSTEILKMCEMIYGKHAADLANPEVDFKGFEAGMAAVVSKMPQRAATTYSAIKKKRVNWINMPTLKKKFKRGACLFF